MQPTQVHDRMTLTLDVEIRACLEGDLPELEWFGVFTAHRALILDAFERQSRGEVLMLVAEVNGFPAGQLWVDLRRGAERSVGFLWAFRVLPLLRGQGLGKRLLAAAERALAARGFHAAEIGVEKTNLAAKRLYERRGYAVVREEREEYRYTTPDGAEMRVRVDEWILCKRLAPARGREATPGHEVRTG